jgi:uncharacterized membrane protein
MEPITLRLAALRESLQSSLWLFPSVGVLVGIAAAWVLGGLGDTGTSLPFVFLGSADSARSILSTIAGSTMTVTSLTFSLTVVALQVASGQFTPRLMRTFLSDRGNQAVLAVFLGTFAYSLVLLQGVQAASDRIQRSIPAIGVTVAVAAAMVSVAALVYFIHHLTVQLRVDKVMQHVAEDTIAVVEATFEPAIVDDEPPEDVPVPDDAVRVTAPSSGYLTGIAVDQLVRAAGKVGASVRLRPSPGQWVVQDTTLAWVWWPAEEPGDDRDGDDPDRDADAGRDRERHDRARRLVRSHLHIADSRTLEADPSFGIRQLVDIAIRALSPGINDPTTAVEAVRQTSRILVVLGHRDLGTIRRRADGGSVVLPRPDFAAHLRLACDQVLRYGRGEPAVVGALAEMLWDLAETCEGHHRRDAIRAEARLLAAAMVDADLPRSAAAPVGAVLDAVHRALDGEVVVVRPQAS